PVLSTIVAEIYGPDYAKQIELANEVQNILKNTTDVVDVDWMVEDDQVQFKFDVDKEKAMLYGVAPQQIAHSLNLALGERAIAKIYDQSATKAVGIVLTLD